MSGIPIYYLSLFKIPVKVARSIEKLMRDFLWEEKDEGKKDHLVNWEVVALSKEKGGLAIGNIVAWNLALLGKWLWRFQLEIDSLWHSVIRSKYGIQDNGRDSRVDLRGSCRAPWKSISLIFTCWSRHLSVRVGNGEVVRFWEDVWMGQSSFAADFPHLYRVARSHNSSIASMACSLLAPIAWNFDFSRNLYDRETSQLVSLLSRVDHFSLSPLLEDKRVWALHSSGIFSCKSFFDYIIDNPQIPQFPFCKKVWKACVPLKVKVFMWALIHGGILTNDTLQKRRPNRLLNPQWCILCCKSGESVDHLFCIVQ